MKNRAEVAHMPYRPGMFLGEEVSVGVIDTQHCNEWTAGLVTDEIQSLQQKGTSPPWLDLPARWMEKVHVVEGNRSANFLRKIHGVGPRFLDSNIATQFRRTTPAPLHENYEGYQAPRIVEDVQKYDIVFDLHGNNELYSWSTIGGDATHLARTLASNHGSFTLLGMPGELVQRASNVVLWDSSTSAYERGITAADDDEYVAQLKTQYVQQTIKYIAGVALGFKPSIKTVPVYRYTYDVSVSDARAYDLKRQYPRFEKFTDPAVLRMAADKGWPADAIAITWDEDAYGAGGYVAEIAIPVLSAACAAAKACSKYLHTGSSCGLWNFPGQQSPEHHATGTGWPKDGA
jgi:hypothetical protein